MLKELIKLTFYGKKTSLYEHVRFTLVKQSKEFGLDFDITEVDNWEQILAAEVESIPAIKIAGHDTMSMTEGEHVNMFVHRVLLKVLKLNHYGNGRKIIVPVDFSKTSENASLFAFELATHTKAVVCLFHVHQPTLNLLDLDKEFQKEKLKKLESFAADLLSKWETCSTKRVLLMTELAVGATLQQITSRTSELNNTWIVMGSSGSGDLMKNAFGSVTTHVVKNAGCPTFVVPPEAKFVDLRKIVLAHDDKDVSSNLSLDVVTELSSKFDAQLYFVHVRVNEMENPLDWMLRIKKKYPECLVHSIALDNRDITNTLIEFAESHKMDLLCLSIRKRGFLEDLFHLSVSKKLTAHSKIPILTIPDQ
jgi:nucleotide-binding universal stress UspA family protein